MPIPYVTKRGTQRVQEKIVCKTRQEPTRHRKTKTHRLEKERKKEDTKNNTQEFRIAYVNANGQIGPKKTQTWRLLEDYSTKYKWDVISFTETHRKEASKSIALPSYKVFEKRRPPNSKKGGGIATLVKQNIQCHEWESTRDRNKVDSELLWIVIK